MESEEFEKFKIKEYNHWELFLHKNQYYLGRVYIWAKREDALDLMEMAFEEREELFEIRKNVNNALEKLFRPNLMNYAALGNDANHLHIHAIPRYKSPRILKGVEFKDERWGKNYAPYNYDFKVPEDILIMIKESIKEIL